MPTPQEIDKLLSDMSDLLIVLTQKMRVPDGDLTELMPACIAISSARLKLSNVYKGEDKSITVDKAFASADEIFGEKVKLLSSNNATILTPSPQSTTSLQDVSPPPEPVRFSPISFLRRGSTHSDESSPNAKKKNKPKS